MNKEIMKAMGFGKEVEEKEKGICPHCHHKVDKTKLIDNIEVKEFKISGLCHDCQKKIFG